MLALLKELFKPRVWRNSGLYRETLVEKRFGYLTIRKEAEELDINSGETRWVTMWPMEYDREDNYYTPEHWRADHPVGTVHYADYRKASRKVS